MSEQLATAEPVVETTGGQVTSEATPSPAPAAAATEEKAHSLDELEAIWDKHHAPPKQEAKPAPDEAAPESGVTDQPSTSPEPEKSSPAIVAPTSWSAENQAKFATLPPDVQQYITKRETEVSQLISRQGAELKRYEPLRDVYSALNSRWGVPQGREAEVVQSWAQAQAILDHNPIEGLKWLAQSYNLDLSQLAGQPPKAQEPASPVDDLFKDPRVDQLRTTYDQKIEKMEQYIRQLGGVVSSREQAEQQRAQQQAARQAADVGKAIQAFSVGKPYFASVEDDLVHEVNFIKAREPDLPVEKVLEKAYDRALYANPQIREQVLADQRKTETEKAQKEAAAKQVQAKKLASMNVRTGASGSTPTFDGPMLDNDKLGALYDRIVSR